MSRKYTDKDIVPTQVLADRLDELAEAVTVRRFGEFVMRIPAERDHCPDLVMSNASRRLIILEKENSELREKATKYDEMVEAVRKFTTKTEIEPRAQPLTAEELFRTIG